MSTLTRTVARIAVAKAVVLGGAAAVLAVTQKHRRLGVSAAEAARPLPGDELLPGATVQNDRARTIDAPAWEVWPWLAQLGQTKAGFYSFEVLENAVGAEIRGTDHVVPAWQEVAVGDTVALAPDVALTVALVEPGRHLVLTSAGGAAPPDMAFDFTWAFALLPAAAPGRQSSVPATRLHVRERYAPHDRRTRALLEVSSVASAIMSWQMLRRIAHLSSGRR